ncbi:hypothetical protein SCHPADRAFT_525922 [Schizopora paradoxa]|uniref:Uncharacterized protein n=1 Tax=Schizopora paradoxa TaxID=27342 RepID=A0A0H2REK6_9AGAM|nr:hypothetical protein SCHPADRAFT_525922 [Schizopora paradoxa]
MPFNHEQTSLGVHPNVEVIGVFRAPTVSSIDTDATADDLPGAGRTVGRILGSLGSKLENVINKWAERSGLGPKAIAEKICRLAGHREIWIEERNFRVCLPVAPGRRFSESQARSVQKSCQKLFGYARSRVVGNQLIALEEVIELSMKDPRIRAIFARSDLDHLITHYNEPDILMATQRALGAIEFSSVHRVWAPILSHATTMRMKVPHQIQKSMLDTGWYSKEDVLETKSINIFSFSSIL